MANWVTETSKSDFDAQGVASTLSANRDATREGAQNGAGFFHGFFGASGYSVVGISADKIPTMRDAIRDYVNSIRNHLDGIEPLADANNAFKGDDIQKAVKSYVEKVKEYCQNLTSDLLAFSDKLQDALDAWESSQRSMAQGVDSAATFDAGSEYRESK